MTASKPAPTLEDAIALAAQAHRGQLYPSLPREPFILHPLRVMLRVASEAERIVAVLHDVIEDTDYTFDDLRRLGYAEEIVSALDHLTHRDGETYEEYIQRLQHHPLARQVKIADITENLENNRHLAAIAPSKEVMGRIKLYEWAINQLRSAATEEPAM